MGTQITIETEEMLRAGWEVEYEVDPAFLDDDGNEWPELRMAVFVKGSHRFYSYSDTCFHADCNAWGNNMVMFQAAGLFNLKHILG